MAGSIYGDDADISGSVVVNEGSGATSDVRVETDNRPYALYVDASDDRVGLGCFVAPLHNIEIHHEGADGDEGIMLIRYDGAVYPDNILGGIGFDSADGNRPSRTTEASAYIAGYASEHHATTDKGGYLVFGTAPDDQDDDTTSTERMRITSDGKVGIGTNSPSATLEVSGTLKITGADEPALLMLDDQDGSAQIGRAHVGYVGSSDFAAFAHQDRATTTEYALAHRSTGQTDINTAAGTNLTFRYASAIRATLDTNGYFSVGANYAPGTHKFAVEGDALVEGNLTVNEYIYHNGDADTWIRFVDNGMTLKAGNISFINLDKKSSAPHELTVNDGSNNIDFVVKGNGSNEGNPAFKVDASTNRVGINGVGSPDCELHVDGDVKVVGEDPRIKIDGDTNSHPGLELYENGTRKWIVYNDYTNDNLTFKTDSTVRMVIDDDGNVGIGTSPVSAVVRLSVDGGQTQLKCDRHASPALTVYNDGDNQYRYGMYIQCGTDDGTATRGIRFYDGDGDTEAGYISWSGGTVTYATFTGAHEASVEPSDYTAGQNSYDYGTVIKIVSTSTGKRHKQVKYVVGPTTSAKDKAVLGVYSENMDPDELESPNDHQIFALGDGHILVCNEGGNIEIGDFICSSGTRGHGMKQDDDLMHSYTVAKAAENVDWSSESSTTKLIACTYHAG